MKKELLVASALVSTLGMAGIAEAASASFSGHQKVGVTGQDLDSADSNTKGENQQSTFGVSISETTDGGIKIATGFDLAEESGSSATVDPQGITLTFTDGSKLDLIEAGSAVGSHVATVPGAGGEQGITATTANNAPSSLTSGSSSDGIGFEWHSAADAFGVDGLKASASFASNDVDLVTGTDNTATVETTYSVGVTYVTTAGDSTVTVAGGLAEGSHNSGTATIDNSMYQVGISAVTGNLTVGAGYSNNDFINQEVQVTGEFSKVGAKYVSGDITFAIGASSGEGKDETYGTAATGAADSSESAGASVAYAVASGVTATLGYTNTTDTNNGDASTNTSGSAWYVGATVSF